MYSRGALQPGQRQERSYNRIINLRRSFYSRQGKIILGYHESISAQQISWNFHAAISVM